MTSSTRRAVLGALAALAPISALAAPACSGDKVDVVGAPLDDASTLRLTRLPGLGAQPLLLICGSVRQGAPVSRFATECAVAGFAALELQGADWSPDAIDRALNWLDHRAGLAVDASRTMAGAEGAGAVQALSIADRLRASGAMPIAGVVGLNGRYGPDAAEMAERVTRDHESGQPGPSVLLLSHVHESADTLALATALMRTRTPFQLQILSEDAAAQSPNPRRALTLARGFIGDGAAAALRT